MSARTTPAVSRRVLATAAAACSLPLSALAVLPAQAATVPTTVPAAVDAVSSVSSVWAGLAAAPVHASLSYDKRTVPVNGKVSATVQVSVAGSTVPGAEVQYYAKAKTSSSWVRFASTTVDSDGYARLVFSPGSTSMAFTADVVTPTGQVPAANVGTVTVAAPATASSSAVARLLAMAAALRGRPYAYGGSGPSAFDCSGFTSYVVRAALGRSLPHNAAAQYAVSQKISRSAIRPGDLIFFTGGGGIYHVGIYAGNGRMWDAQHPGTTTGLHSIFSSSWVAGRIV